MAVTVLRQQFEVSYEYPVVFARDVFAADSPVLREVLEAAGEGPHRVMTVIDSGLLEAAPGLPARIRQWAQANADRVSLTGEPLIFQGGEVCKTAPLEVQQFYDRIADEAICRHSFVLVLGGGAVQDAAGFAAATAHRGVKLIRMPSTVLSQNDAGVGVKNAINHGKRKNFVGTFAPPFAVVNDLNLLATLSPRDLRAGMAEAVKVAMIKDAHFFDFLHGERKALAAFEEDAMRYMIERCAALHLAHIGSGGDPFEQGSARPLDFGHWLAHKLEEVTFGSVRHGEAVAIGIMLDSLYSWRMNLISGDEMHAVTELFRDLGFGLFHYELNKIDISRALDEFREHLGGQLCITLPDGIGRGREHNRIDAGLMAECLKDLQRLAADREINLTNLDQLELPLAV
ncbi:3-dehydroquinate synthase [Granulosicoccaceae sp. 1_MG-2023]|nr:3-dehydroquinate synthase [Granulosicoccaceae sp. 1_MG-2023]